MTVLTPMSLVGKSFLNPAVRMSNYFMPTLRDIPAEAQIVSHRLMLRAGMIRQSASGIYSWLPLGFRVLKKIEQIVREEQERADSHELLMPTIQSAELWQKSGRYDDYGLEMLRIRDRHDRELLYGPTNEELITAIFRDSGLGYRDFPRLVYQMQWKFRDELRPRFGIMRAREFYMKDGYSFDLDEAQGQHSYNKMFVSYLRTFARLGLRAIPMRADTGPIGGENSHEFIILADTGESTVYLDKDMLALDALQTPPDYNSDLSPIIKEWTRHFAVTDEEHDNNPQLFQKAVPKNRQIATKGIEVGHIFFFGDKYAEPMGAYVTDKDGKKVALQSGSYGIGVSRLAGAIIEACHDDKGIIWPIAAAPFAAALINLQGDDRKTTAACDELFAKITECGIETIYDDRKDIRAGAKLFDADLIGLPYQIIVGKRGLAENTIEIKHRKTQQITKISTDAAMEALIDLMRNPA